MGWDKWTNGHLCVRGMTYWLMMMHKWLFFANDISGSYGIRLYFHAFFSLSIAQPTPKPRPTFEWAGWMSQRTQRRDRRLRFQLPSLRFASYWNSMCIVDCRLVKQKKTVASRTNSHTLKYSHFYSVELVLVLIYFCVRFLTAFIPMVCFSWAYKEYRLWWRGACVLQVNSHKTHTHMHMITRTNKHFDLFNVLVSNSDITYWHLFLSAIQRVSLFMGVAAIYIGFVGTTVRHWWWLTEYEIRSVE